ncbi:MAG TPA: host attachment protein [Xanthobacteraceae bacterium]|nr:host attachment protein [Xanthobacteraceae bacterium]
MQNIKIPHNGYVFVGDGRKALVLRNEGDEKFPNLKTEEVFHDTDNPRTSEQGSDQPTRGFAGARGAAGPRSAIEQTDWHDLEEHRFARDVAAALERIVRERKIEALVVAAPPRTLADLRQAFHAEVKKRIIAELDKDLTKHPVHEIERLLVK